MSAAPGLGWLALAGMGTSVAIMVVISVAGPSAAVVRLAPSLPWPPWWVPLHLSLPLVTLALWLAAFTGAGGLVAGLVAIRHGARPPGRLLVAAALAVTAALAVLPAAGSTDVLDYAAYGRIMVLGHNPYLMTPHQLRLRGDPVGAVIPAIWSRRPSVYGPLASFEQGMAAELGGSSPARIVFWLKAWNALAFALVVLMLDRLMRADPARRARAHLLWSVNPLLLWTLVASGHVDTIAAALGLAGVLLVTPGMVSAGWRGRWRLWLPGLGAGVLVGMATDVKITFVMFGLGIAYAARRSGPTLAAAGAGALAVLGPSYLWFGRPAVHVLVEREATATSDNFYQLLARPFGLHSPPGLMLIVVPLLAGVGWLLVRRLPDGLPGRPAVGPALAFSLAWLLVWPYQRPWYDAMALCLLAIYPASRLDWPVLVRLAAGTFYYLPGLPGRLPANLKGLFRDEEFLLVPLVRLLALAAVVALCLTGAWTARPGPLRRQKTPRSQKAPRSQGTPRSQKTPRRPVSARIPAVPAPGPVAHAPVDVPPGRGSGGPGPPGRHPPDPG